MSRSSVSTSSLKKTCFEVRPHGKYEDILGYPPPSSIFDLVFHKSNDPPSEIRNLDSQVEERAWLPAS